MDISEPVLSTNTSSFPMLDVLFHKRYFIGFCGKNLYSLFFLSAKDEKEFVVWARICIAIGVKEGFTISLLKLVRLSCINLAGKRRREK